MVVCSICQKNQTAITILVEEKPKLWYRHSEHIDNSKKKSDDPFVPLKRRKIELCEKCKGIISAVI